MEKFIKIGKWISYISACIGLSSVVILSVFHKLIIEMVNKTGLDILCIIIGMIPTIITILFTIPNIIAHKKSIYTYDKYYKKTNFLYLLLFNIITMYSSFISTIIFHSNNIWIIACIVLIVLGSIEILTLSHTV